MPAIALPRLIEEKFDDLTRQVRRLWLWRGISRAVVAAVLAAFAVILADRFFNFSSAGRWIAMLSWSLVVLAAIWRFVVRPQRQSLTTETLAAAIETQFPSLSERLMTLVDLSHATDPGNGSRPLIDLLVRDTAQRTKRLNFERAAPAGPAIRLGLVAGLLVGSGLLAILFVSGGADRVKRLLLPWHTSRIDVPYAIKVSSGSVIVKRGEPVTLTAYLERLQAEAVLPANAVLIAREKATNAEKKFPMSGDEQASFHVTRPAVADDFDYRIEAGNAASEWFSVTATDPVELAEGTVVMVVPPEYAVPPLLKASLPGFASIASVQHTQIQFTFHFNRPAAAAKLDWLSNAPNASVASERIKIVFAEDRRSATATTSLVAGGTFVLTLTGEHGVTTVISTPANAIADAPPRFEKAVGISERPREVRPEESIVLEVAVVDDFRVESLVLEWAVNGGKVNEVPVPLRDLGTARAEGKHVFSLAGQVKEGDVLTYRWRATDNRRVPSAGLAPQTAYFPEKGPATLKISSNAESLDQQDILSQRDELSRKLQEAVDLASEARRETERLRRELSEKPMPTPEQVARRQAARDAAARAAQILDDAAKEAALTPELRSLAESMRATANDQLRNADELLRRSENEPNVRKRNGEIESAEKQLAAARERIEALAKQNEDLARNRLDKRRLEKLADEVNRLAAEAEKATDPKQRDEVLRKLQNAKDELRDVVNGNDALRHGTENSVNEKARELAGEAGKLRQDQRKLDEEIAKSEAEARHKALAETAAKQAELNKKADALREKSTSANGDEPLARAPFDDAAKKLGQGDSVNAMTEQEKAARDLERLADDIEKAAAQRKDSRQAAKQLAKLQEDLRQKMAEAAKKPLTDAEKAKFAEQQEALSKAVEKLSTPGDHPSSNLEKAKALEKLKAANDAVARNPGTAGAAQQEAAEAIKKLAEKLPRQDARLKAAKEELDRLMRDQEAIGREAEEKLKGYEKKKPDGATQSEIAAKLAAQTKKQEELAERLAALDAPGYEARRDRAAESARHAGEDLARGLPQDIPASQADLKKTMARLRTALDGGTPTDSLADDLARKQNRLVDRLENTEPDAANLADLQKLQREISDKLGTLPDPEGADRLLRAKQSAQSAAKQYQKPDDVDELRKKTKQAAKDLDDLADHLAGLETDRQRIERLAKQRQERADWSKNNAAKPTPPEQAVAAQGELDRELADLKQTRAGSAQEEKKAAIDHLEKLRRTPNAERAPALQQAAAEALDQLAKKMKGEAKRGDRPGPEGDTSGDAGGQLPSQADAEKARAMAQQQRDLRDRTAKAASEAKPDPKALEEQAKKQKALADRAEKLAKGMDAASNAPTNTESTANSLTQGSEAAKKAQGEMEKAAREQSAGRQSSSAEAREDAAKSLDRAKAEANAAAGISDTPPDPKATAASKSAEEAGGLLREAGQDAKSAPSSLKKAAEKIGDAADRLGEVGKNPQEGGKPGGNDGSGAKPLTAADLPPDLQQYAGKPWGELPGDVKARIIQDLKAKYGEDYARVIKLYFEQLAEKK